MLEPQGFWFRTLSCVGFTLICLPFRDLAHAGDDDGESEGVQERILTRSTQLQRPGELQVTLGLDRVEGPDGWSSEVESEIGLTRWLQLSVSTSLLTARGEPRDVELSAMLNPPVGSDRWRVAFGANRSWALEGDEAEAVSEFAALASLHASTVEVTFDAALRQEGLAPVVGLAAVFGRGPWFPIVELSSDLEESETTVSPGLAWHAPGGFEISAGTPLTMQDGRLVSAGAIRFDKEWALVE